MKKDLFKSVVIGFGLLLFVVVALWVYSRYSEIRTAVMEKKKAETVGFVKSRASALAVPEIFTAGDVHRQRHLFQSFFDAIRSPELIGIKILDRNLVVVWSNISELAGRRSVENRAAREALAGAGEFGNEQPIHTRFPESRFDELSQTYVPIFDAQGGLVGVVEVFQPSRWLQEEIRSQFQNTALPVGAFMLIGYGALVILLRILMAPKSLGVGENPI